MPAPSPVAYTNTGPGPDWWLLAVVIVAAVVLVAAWCWVRVRAARGLDVQALCADGAGDRAGAAFGSGPAHTPAPVPVLVEGSEPPVLTWEDLVAAVKPERPEDEVHAAVVEAGLRVGPPRPQSGVYAPGTAGPVRLGAASGGGAHGTCRSAHERGDRGWVCVWCRPHLDGVV